MSQQNTTTSSQPPTQKKGKNPHRSKPKPRTGDSQTGSTHNSTQGTAGNPQQASTPKLRGLPKDSPDVRLSKTVTWILRHAAGKEGLEMRSDGYIRVDHLLENPRVKSQNLTLEQLKGVVATDSKGRFDLILENEAGEKITVDVSSSPTSSSANLSQASKGIWWIKATQGHSIKTVQLDLKPILSVSDVPSGIAVHGTTQAAWQAIKMGGLSKMERNHIHLAQGVPGSGVISGMRKSSQVYIYIDLKKALDAGVKFFLSDNGVVLTEGNEKALLLPDFFLRVEDAEGRPLQGWEGSEPVTRTIDETT